MSKLTRQEAFSTVQRGGTVLHNGREYRVNRHGKKAERFPQLPEGEEGFEAMRDAQGNLTRRGMEHVLATGGAVMHYGLVIDRVDELPDEVQLAGVDETKLAAERSRIDGEIAKLASQRADVEKRAEEARRKGEQLHREMAQQGQKQQVVVEGDPLTGEQSKQEEHQQQQREQEQKRRAEHQEQEQKRQREEQQRQQEQQKHQQQHRPGQHKRGE